MTSYDNRMTPTSIDNDAENTTVQHRRSGAARRKFCWAQGAHWRRLERPDACVCITARDPEIRIPLLRGLVSLLALGFRRLPSGGVISALAPLASRPASTISN